MVVAPPHTAHVEFSYQGARTSKVQLAGDMDAWSKPIDMTFANKKWVKAYDFPSDARIEYKFVVDNEWILDPKNPKHNSNGMGGENSVWQGPDYKASVNDATPEFPLHRSEIMVGDRTVVVFAPADSSGLPILIYGDGEHYEADGKVQNVVENLVEGGKIRPVVIVLVPPIDRMKEYGPEWKTYGQYVLGPVLAAVRAATHASESAKDVYMGGSSMGGLISLRLAEEFPDKLAGGIECQSAAIQWEADNLHYYDIMKMAKLKSIAPTTRLWFDWGTFEDGLTTANQKLTHTLTGMGREYGSKVTDEGHTWTAWRGRMAAGLTYILGSPH